MVHREYKGRELHQKMVRLSLSVLVRFIVDIDLCCRIICVQPTCFSQQCKRSGNILWFGLRNSDSLPGLGCGHSRMVYFTAWQRWQHNYIMGNSKQVNQNLLCFYIFTLCTRSNRSDHLDFFWVFFLHKMSLRPNEVIMKMKSEVAASVLNA